MRMISIIRARKSLTIAETENFAQQSEEVTCTEIRMITRTCSVASGVRVGAIFDCKYANDAVGSGRVVYNRVNEPR